ncbi:hypothetical protein A3A79_04965 [Candidatus Gottesmanbacteria bacterium RIFCSPLOWO2_01_FULL_43_11b]|uniref:Methyltransferase domain-containing protein n=1 Tax=Candidatus Gottesmanbacteria bacterium RIFCSPLOWO2_01_FULL_43_11b TaxID=1798392 RepID=A0A1F6AIQ2_9BACT|nr:MAG: hypothetical protein A3A79_04965 [Candidatus Gottesmanbacteria bacterium RIFCSPLOWO2_01_FULL_43_11b]
MDFPHVAKRLIEKYPHDSILEIGCGPGTIMKFIRPKYYVGVDNNLSYIQYARKHFGSPARNFLFLNAQNLQPLNKKFDIVLFMNVIHHMTDVQLQTVLSNLTKNIRFKRIILFDSKPDLGPLSAVLEKIDEGENFRELPEIKKIFRKQLTIERSFVIKKFYWLYKYPTIIAKKTLILPEHQRR